MRFRPEYGGPIAWMAKNPVAANLLMLVLIVGGIFMMTQIRQEYLPNTEPDIVSVSVALPGATPAEVEQSIVLALEDALSSVQGIDKLSANAAEGAATITLELGRERSRLQVFNDIQRAVDGVTSLPEDAEEPDVSLKARRWAVLDVMLYGDTDPMSIRMAAEHVRTVLLQYRGGAAPVAATQDRDWFQRRADGLNRMFEPELGVSQADISNERDIEIHVELSQGTLRAHGLTLAEVAGIIREQAVDRSGGTLETRGGDLLLRMADRRADVIDFAAIPILTDPRGTVLRLGDIAEINRGFGDSTYAIEFDGKTAIEIEVFRVGDETPISVSRTVHEALPLALSTLPEGIEGTILNDRSEYYRGRMELLTRNGLIGLGLVLLLLSLFLEMRLAFWVALGIPTAFMGTLLVLPWTDQSINLISMFAFILALGIVVDDAIVAGENIYEYRQRGMDRLEAAIKGARDISVPLSFSILTNIVAFIPLALVPGWMGKLWFVIPVVVSLAFLMSWIEALFILPAHLAGEGEKQERKAIGPLRWLLFAIGKIVGWVFGPFQWVFSRGLALFTRAVYGPTLKLALAWRYTTVALMIAVLMIASAWVASGRMGFGLFPPVPRDYSKAVVSMPVGTHEDITFAARDQVVAAAERVIAANGGDKLGAGIRARVEGNSIDVRTYLTPPEVRPISTRAFTSAWRKELGTVITARSARFESSWGGPGGTSLEIRLSHADSTVLEKAAADLAGRLAEYSPVRDPDDGFRPGKAQLEFRLAESGRALGLSSQDVAAQVRAAFFGVEALAQQEGRNEVSIRIRAPDSERRSEADVERLLIRTPDGGFVPLYEVAEAVRGRADASIDREDAQRVVSVTANVEPRGETNQVIAAATADVLPQMQADYPGLGYSLEGRQAAQRDTMKSFFTFSIPLALLIIYGLLAIPFRSYVQPLVIMCAIPFGFVGAVLGHLIMDYDLSIISVFGIIALSGVVINAGIVMIDYANKKRLEGAIPFEAIREAGMRRFRPILLTTVTTFGGLAPMIFETSRQARFLVPMAISLGYGIVFATLVVLFLIPALYLVLEDLRRLFRPEPEEIPPDNLPVPAE